MTAHIMQHSTEAWPMTPSTWVSATACGGSGSTWSKRMANASNDSWEVRAFAEDASSSGQWPPRSYSCSFCQREFRTAQALGGHMNVHRRERAHANQLASLRAASARLTSTVELLSPVSMSVSGSVALNSGSVSTTPLSSSPISQESISSSSELSLLPNTTTVPTWAPSSRGAGFSYHPYEKTSPRHTQAGARFSFCLNKVMNEHEDNLDLELRLGRSSCAV